MTQHNNLIRLHHMLEAATKAVHLVEGKSRAELDTDEKLLLAVTRLIEILGEAANYVPLTCLL